MYANRLCSSATMDVIVPPSLEAEEWGNTQARLAVAEAQTRVLRHIRSSFRTEDGASFQEALAHRNALAPRDESKRNEAALPSLRLATQVDATHDIFEGAKEILNEANIHCDLRRYLIDITRALMRQAMGIMVMSERYPCDEDLYRSVFGGLPSGDISAVRGPLLLSFRINKLQEYAKQRFKKKNPSVAERAEADRSGGNFLRRKEFVDMGLGNAVSIEKNTERKTFVGQSVGIYIHEERHALNSYYRGADAYPLFYPPHYGPRHLIRMSESIRYFVGDVRGKDEILAYFTENGSRICDIGRTLLEPGGLYDYFLELQNGLRKTVKKRHHGILGQTISGIRAQYERNIRDGLDGVGILQGSGLEKEMIVELLLLEPLETWKPFAQSVVDARVRSAY